MKDNLIIAGLFLMIGLSGYSIWISIHKADIAYSEALNKEAADYLDKEYGIPYQQEVAEKQVGQSLEVK